MTNHDALQRFLFENAPVRGELVYLRESYQTIVGQHAYAPPVRKLLGEALAMVCMLSSMIKFKGRLTLQFQGKGKLKLLVAQCDEEMHIRGLVQSAEGLDMTEVNVALQQGTLAITMDPNIQGGNRYQGIVEWQAGQLAQSIEHYFQFSEQLSTRIWLAVDEHQAAGMLLQLMPKQGPDYYQNEWEHLVHLANTVTANELLTLDNKVLLHRLYHEEDVRIFSPVPVSFQCNCSVARSENAVLLLGREEVDAELAGKARIVVTCEFCNKEYSFDRIDVARIFKNDKPLPLH